jgi:hypothetical protein
MMSTATGATAAVGDVRLTIRSSRSALSEKPLGPSASIGIACATGRTHVRSARLMMTNRRPATEGAYVARSVDVQGHPDRRASNNERDGDGPNPQLSTKALHAISENDGVSWTFSYLKISSFSRASRQRCPSPGRQRDLRQKDSRSASLIRALLDDLIRSQQQRLRDGEAERLRGLEIDD